MSHDTKSRITLESTVLNSTAAYTVLDSRDCVVIVTTSRLIADRHYVYTRALNTVDRVAIYQDLASRKLAQKNR